MSSRAWISSSGNRRTPLVDVFDVKTTLSREGEASEADNAKPCYSSSSFSSYSAHGYPGVSISLAVTLDVTNRPLPSVADPFLRNKQGSKLSSLFVVAFRILTSKLLFPLLLFYICCIICGGSNGLVVCAMSCNISADCSRSPVQRDQRG